VILRVLTILAFVFLDYNSLHALTKKFTLSKNASNKETDLAMIDSQIQSLENLKAHYLAKASRWRSKGDRLQFNTSEDGLVSAQKSWKSADEYDRIADKIQGDIDNLKKERQEVIDRSDY
jgi:hypothetical protein